MPATQYVKSKGIGDVNDTWHWDKVTWPGAVYTNGDKTHRIRRQIGEQSGVKTPRSERIAFWRANGYFKPEIYNIWMKDLNYAKILQYWSWDNCNGAMSQNFYHDGTSTVRLDNCPLLTSSDPKFQSLRDKVVSKLNSDVRSNSAGMGETAFEMRKTADMILGVQGKVLSAYRHVRKFRFQKAAKVLGLDKPPARLTSRSKMRRTGASPSSTAASNWLEYRYGWIPLYSTVYGLMEALHKFHTEKPPVIRVSRRQWLEEEYTPHGWGEFSGWAYPQTNSPWGQSLKSGNFKSRVTAKRTLSVSGVYYYRVKSPLVGGLGVLGLDNPLLLAWELVPLSFVADWFVNVSDVLEQLSSFNGKEFLSGCLSYTEKGTLWFEVAPLPNTGCVSGFASVPATKTTSSQYQMTRAWLTGPATVGLTINIDLNAKRVADAAALFKQLVLR